jgi:hypothetical protein
MFDKILVAIFCAMSVFIVNGYCEVGDLAQKVEVITRDSANYANPKNTLAARRSALLLGDLEWADETMTRESLEEEIRDYLASSIDRSRLFDLEKNVKEAYIVNKVNYQDAVLLIVEGTGYDGSVRQVPFPYVMENGLWKFTNKFSSDEILLDYLHFIPPLFDGKGQSPDEVNSFLGYEKPTQVQSELESGTVSYTVHIYYGKSVVPETFSATLNKNDISTKFSPEPFTDEEVFIPLQQGRSVLLLSVEGIKTNGKKAKDSDRLVFVVP